MEKKFQKRGHAERFLSSEEKKKERREKKKKKNKKHKECARVPLTFDGFSSTWSSSSFIYYI